MPHAASRELEHGLFACCCQTGACPFPNLTQQPEAKMVFFGKPAQLHPFQVVGCRITFGLLFQTVEKRLTILSSSLHVWRKMNQLPLKIQMLLYKNTSSVTL